MFARLFYPSQADVKIKFTIDALLNDDDGRLIKVFTDSFSVNCLEYLFALREGIEAKLNEISAGLPGVKKQIAALGFDNKNNALDDPEIVHMCAISDWHLKDYVKNADDKKAIEPLMIKLQSCEQMYLNQMKLQLVRGMLEMTIAARPVADKQELEKLQSRAATDVHEENKFIKAIYGKFA